MIDVASRKVINHFVLNTPTKQYRFWSGSADPQGKVFYTVTKEIEKLPEHYEVGKAKYPVIDLDQKKIVGRAHLGLRTRNFGCSASKRLYLRMIAGNTRPNLSLVI